MLDTLPPRRFAWYTLFNGLAFVSAWMQRLALGWVIWQLTHSGLWLGLLSICDLGPALLVGPIGGVLGDRGHPERVVAWGQAAAVALTGLTGVAVWYGVPAWALLALAVVGGAAASVQDSARAVMVQSLVPAERLGPAIAINAVVINLARFVGPALAGLIATLADVVQVFPVAAAMGLGLAWFAARARVEPRVQNGPSAMLHDIREGAAYAASQPLIRLVLLNFLLACLFARPVYELVPGLADGLFNRAVGGLAAMTTAIGLGAVLAGLLLLRGRSLGALGSISCAGALIGGLGAMVIAEMPSFAGALVMAGILGFGIALCGIAAQILVQTVARDDVRNRVLALWGMIIRGAPALGAVALGALADHFGFRLSLGGAGAIALVAALACWLALRRQLAKAA